MRPFPVMMSGSVYTLLRAVGDADRQSVAEVTAGEASFATVAAEAYTKSEVAAP